MGASSDITSLTRRVIEADIKAMRKLKEGDEIAFDGIASGTGNQVRGYVHLWFKE